MTNLNIEQGLANPLRGAHLVGGMLLNCLELLGGGCFPSRGNVSVS